MGYYHIELSPKSKELCTIVIPWVKYKYQKLPMGLCNSPEIFQEKMDELFAGFENVCTCIDVLLILGESTWDTHVKKIDKVIKKLKSAGLKVNLSKSFFIKS